MTWVLTTILCIILIEMVLRLPLPAVISEISKIGRKSLRTLSSKSVSDHWKEKAILAYAGSMFASTSKLAGYLAVIGAVAIFLALAFDYAGARVVDFVTSWVGVLFSSIIAMLYLASRRFFV